jgi:tetratricopeptide (TPR) repeat protein
VIRVWLGWAFVCAGEYDEGLALLDPTLQSPDPWQRFRRADALIRAGRYREAIADFEALMQPGQFPPDGLAYAYAKAGDSLRARAVVEERARRLGDLSAPDREQISRLGSLGDDLAVGDHEQLIRRLQEMYDRKYQSMRSRCEPYYADLLEIEGAKAILEKLGLPL